VNNEISGEVGIFSGLLGVRNEGAIGDAQVMVVDELFALKMQFCHMHSFEGTVRPSSTIAFESF